MNDSIVIVTGGFDPIHSGHIEYIKAARELGRVVVGVNSDAWLVRKKGQSFMPFEERLNIINNLKDVMVAIAFDDSDDSAKDVISQVRKLFPKNKIIFANGGDRTKENIPEMDTEVSNIDFVFGVGGENKLNSSSWILQEWKAPKTERTWGYYRVLHTDGPGLKVKELTINPHSTLSMQRHQDRNEFWKVSEGTATVRLGTNPTTKDTVIINKFEEVSISCNMWHQLINNSDKELKVIEIQYGTNCLEEDIERYQTK